MSKRDAIGAAIEAARPIVPEPTRQLRPITVADLLSMEIPPRRHLLEPWLPEAGLAMVYAQRGVGKTWFTLSAAIAVASGGGFLGFRAPTPQKVLVLDGEMPAATLQERVASIVAGADQEADPEFLRLLASDLHPDGLPDLSTTDGQEAIEPYLADVDLIVVDNLSTLVRNGRENEADSWIPVQDWILRQRRAGRSVLLVHHAGKGGAQRGTSKREDVLDTVIQLRRPADYTTDRGAVFEVHFEKARGITGSDAMPFEATVETRNGAAVWSRRSAADAEMLRVVALKNDGATVRDIAEELGISKSKVDRIIQRARTEGALRDGE